MDTPGAGSIEVNLPSLNRRSSLPVAEIVQRTICVSPATAPRIGPPIATGATIFLATGEDACCRLISAGPLNSDLVTLFAVVASTSRALDLRSIGGCSDGAASAIAAARGVAASANVLPLASADAAENRGVGAGG